MSRRADDGGADNHVQVPLDVWDTLQDLSAAWKKKTSVATDASDPRYKSYTEADEAVEGLLKGMTTLVTEEHVRRAQTHVT
jgi:lipid II:glycine glycyltransferase (peptidoglycan interpeptide bridge formation enzyme)